MFDERLSVGISYAKEFVREASRALRGRAFSNSKPISQDEVKKFFEARSANMANEHSSDDIIAIASVPYQTLISSATVRKELNKLSKDSLVVDYGCGSGGFLSVLRHSGFTGRYIGYDLDCVTIDTLRQQHGDLITSFHEVHSLIESFDLAFLCNVLVYNQDKEVIELLQELRESMKESATIIIMEPHPKWYWEFEFDGIYLAPRCSTKLSEMLRESGWLVTRSVDVSLISTLGIPLFPIAYSLVAN